VQAAGGPADVTVVCVDVPGCEQPAILATAQGGTIIFFSMATSFAAAALGAEGLAADVRMLVGNGYVPGHAAYAMGLVRRNAAVRGLFESRVSVERATLRLAGLAGADHENVPWVNHLVDAVRGQGGPRARGHHPGLGRPAPRRGRPTC
jgi:hypothetical protein